MGLSRETEQAREWKGAWHTVGVKQIVPAPGSVTDSCDS